MAGMAVEVEDAGTPDRHRLRGVVAFLIIYLIWGSTFLAIRYAVETIPPFFTAATRHLIAGSILLAWAWAKGERPSAQAWRMGLILGFLFFLVGHGTLHWAETRVPSGVAALVVAVEPIFVAWMVPLFRLGAPPGARTYLGLALGAASVAVLFQPDVTTGEGIVPGLLAVLLGSLSWAAGIVLSRKLQERPDGQVDTSAMNAALPLLCGSAMLLVGGLALGEHDTFAISSVSTLSLVGLVYLIVFGSLLAFTAYSWLLRHYPPTLVATHTYVNPIVALILGWALAGERITTSIVISAALAIVAIALVNTGEQQRA
jgi:drug/metabolite transporter (DMT)-like permease